MKSKFRRILALAVVAVFAAASAAFGQKVTIKIAYPTGAEMPEQAMKNAYKEFSKSHPNVNFKELTAPMVDFENVVLKTILAKGDVPDLYYLTGGSWQLSPSTSNLAIMRWTLGSTSSPSTAGSPRGGLGRFLRTQFPGWKPDHRPLLRDSVHCHKPEMDVVQQVHLCQLRLGRWPIHMGGSREEGTDP